jgi:NitT/TauT family transport system ATP-binding protein
VVSDALELAPPATTGLAGGALDVQNVSHGFVINKEMLQVLQNVTLHAEPGEFVALLGPSGCGKSTLLRLVAGLDLPRRGRLLVDGVEVTGPDPSRVVVFQDPTLFPWRTVWKNVSLGLEAQGTIRHHGARVDDALKLVGLHEFAHVYPHQLSGGMAQRASLARALVNDPRLMILDEPLGKLDSLTRMTMQGELTRLWQEHGFTVLMVTHDVEEALLLAQRVIVFSERPAVIRADLRVDLPYPRHRDEPELLRLRREALGLLGLEATW